jgi:hypothetical protein
MVITRRSLGFLIAVSMSLGPVFLLPSLGLAQRKACIAFYLRNDEGKIINPLTGENAGQKIFFWFTGVLTLIMGVTGIMLIFRDSASWSLPGSPSLGWFFDFPTSPPLKKYSAP